MYKLAFRAAALTAGIFFTAPCLVHAATADPVPVAAHGIRVPQTQAQIMPLDEVRVGMRGYGRSVFAGDDIETFAVVVRSVVSDSSAARGTIWVECTDERMTRSGPVQGMSGSPIYLWDDSDQDGKVGVDGEGGRLIGAFAFGYTDVNVCLVGVQPIAYMREVGDNAVATENARIESGTASRDRGVGPHTLSRSLARMARQAQDAGVPPRETTVLRALQQVLGDGPEAASSPGHSNASWSTQDAAPRALGLPVSVGSAEAARWLAPVLAPAGLAVRAGGAGASHLGGPRIAGTPPSNVDAPQVVLEPGSVLSIPLAWGDLDLNASGTVTEVRPDGTVLAFGHAMNAVGATRLPIATGYTHFVVSRSSISFKQSSSLELVGTLMRDEQAAVAGRPLHGAGTPEAAATAFGAAPVTVHVELPGQPARDYNYMIVDDPTITAGMLAAVVVESVNAVQEFPRQHTVRLSGTMTYTGGRTLKVAADLPTGGARGISYTLLPGVSAMMQNQFEPLKLESADIKVVVDKGIDRLLIKSATLDRGTAYPGETVSVAVQLAPYQQPLVTHRIDLPLPDDLPEGEYEVLITDVDGFVSRMMASSPNLVQVRDIDELYTTVATLATVDGNTLYAAIARPTPGVAVGSQPLPALPGSRAAVLGAAPTTRVSLYPRFIEAAAALDHPVIGSLKVPLVVQARR